tara:strand:- start:479 stop:1342 length:864 start_codon:yes stop_codon:yes gene_type:complete
MNPYRISEPTAISFSGGRTSAFMLYKCLEAHDGRLPDEAVVTFANTGKEMPETLDFVQACADNWDVDIVWLEREIQKNTEDKPKYLYRTRVVDHDTASRNGKPFAELIKARRYAPNPIARFCTQELKIKAIGQFLCEERGFPNPYVCFIGIRSDEQRRATKMHDAVADFQERHLPLWLDGITKEDIHEFWINQNFDLQLPNNNGITDWGNCDLCFLKGMSKKMSIIEARPDLADWWSEQEQSLSKAVGKEAYFRKDQPSYTEMKVIASDQRSLFGFDDETIPCFCGD